jgi:hypothetical protein
MSPPFQVGDRVRLTPKYRGSQFRSGDMGTIVAVLPPSSPQKGSVYQVRLDAGEATLYPAFYEEELERA